MPDCEKNCVLAARVDRLEEDMKSEKENRQKNHSEGGKRSGGQPNEA